jgi:hypothetical protein
MDIRMSQAITRVIESLNAILKEDLAEYSSDIRQHIQAIVDNELHHYQCAREGCPEQWMQYNPYTLSGGYGSTVLDMEPDLTFCSLQCLRLWVTTGVYKDVQN